MALLVKKFGGTSVGDIKKIKNIASSICQSKEAGNENCRSCLCDGANYR